MSELACTCKQTHTIQLTLHVPSAGSVARLLGSLLRTHLLTKKVTVCGLRVASIPSLWNLKRHHPLLNMSANFLTPVLPRHQQICFQADGHTVLKACGRCCSKISHMIKHWMAKGYCVFVQVGLLHLHCLWCHCGVLRQEPHVRCQFTTPEMCAPSGFRSRMSIY